MRTKTFGKKKYLRHLLVKKPLPILVSCVINTTQVRDKWAERRRSFDGKFDDILQNQRISHF